MKHHRLSVLTVLVFFVAPCFAHHMAVIVDKDNNVGSVSSVHLAKVFRTEIKEWPDVKRGCAGLSHCGQRREDYIAAPVEDVR
jgi:hypothetical protein